MATSTGSGDYDVVVGPYNANASTTIATGHTVTLTDNVTGNNFFQIQAGATLVGGGFSITVDNESSSDLTFLNNGTISGVLDVIITNPHGVAAIDFTGQGGNVRNLTINNASTIATIQDDTTLDGNLTITSGELNTKSGSNHALIVTGTTTIGPDSGGADQATLTCNASAISLGSGKTDGAGLNVKTGGTFTGGSGTHTIGSIVVDNNANAKFTNTSGTATLNGHSNDNTRTINIAGGSTCVAAGTMDVTFGTSSKLQISNQAGVNNLTLTGNVIYRLQGHSLISGALTITSGTTLDTQTTASSGTFRNLTVAGYCDVTGTLTLRGSAVSVGALRTNSGAEVTQGSSGTLALATGSNFGGTESVTFSWKNSDGTSDINLGGTITISGGSYFQPRTAPDYASVVNNVVWDSSQYWVDKMTFGGTLVVNASKKMETYNGSKDCIVNGDVTLNGELKALGNNVSAMTFGSLTIASGGTYNATSGTTTILGSSGGFALLDEGTFTHNSGTVKIDFETSNLNSSTRIHQNGAKKLNNVEIEMNRTTDEVLWSVASGTSQGIAGNLTLTKGESYLYSLAHDFDVDGNFLVDANGTWGSLGHTGAHEAGSLTINSGGTYMATSGTTTITTATGAGSSSNRAFFCHNAGVFTHNKGLLKTTASSADLEFTSQSETNNPLYDFEATQYAIAAANEWTVMNNMTIANGFQFNGGAGRAKVYGIMKQTGGTYNASDVSSSTDHFFNHYRLEGGTLDLSNIDITVGSIRNTGGTIS